MPLQLTLFNGEEFKNLEIEFVWNDGIHKTAFCKV